MPYAVISAGFLQSSIALGGILTILKKTNLLLWLGIFGNSIIIILNLIFTRQYGIEGLLISMALGSVIHIIWMFFLVLRLHVEDN